MNKEEAISLCNNIEAKIIVPTHYGLIVGEKNDGEAFKKMLSNKRVEVLI